LLGRERGWSKYWLKINSIHSKFEGVIVPDIDPQDGSKNLSGKLCRTNLNVTKRRVYYAGILTSTKKMALIEDLDYLAIVSGPEPQRTKLEENRHEAGADASRFTPTSPQRKKQCS
jgi:hypothetical protein